MARGFLDEYRGRRSEDSEEMVSVRVRIEHQTPRALQVSPDGGDTVVWVPRDAVASIVPAGAGPGDTVTISIPERMAEERGL